VTSCSWTPHKSQVFIDKFDPCAILAQDAYCQKWRIFKRAAHVKFPVVSSARHKGKTIEIDSSKEVITLVGINGEPMGSLAWDFLVDQILTYRKPPQSREARSEPRISLSIRVKYQTPEGTPFESRAGGIGGGGLFIESFTPLAVGTKIAMEFTLPESPSEWLSAKGVIAWVCPKADQYTFSPGMGVRFTDIATDTRNRVLNLVHSVKGLPQSETN
jgi:uncharacterized protein (TIGR02266 family)